MTLDRSRLRAMSSAIRPRRPTGSKLAVLAVLVVLGFDRESAFAQTLNLGNAGSDGFFAVANSNTGGGDFNFSNTVDEGGATLGAGTFLGGSGTIVGNLIADPSATNTGVNVLGTSGSSPSLGTYIAGLGVTATTVANTAAGWSSSGANVLTPTLSGSNYQFTGSSSNSGDNVINVNSSTGLLALTNATITLSATSPNEQFVFNITGRMSWTNVTVVLNGVSSNNVFYNVISGNIGINSGSNLSGVILNVISGSGMSIDNSIVNGAIVSDGFVDMANSVIAPELPTAAMAGFVSIAVLGHAVFAQKRRRLRNA